MSFQLEPHKNFPGVTGPVVICVMDGIGIGRRDESDAVWLARTPHLDRLATTVPTLQLIAHGRGVGMPSDTDMGNSEVGHNALGAGRIFDQGAKLVGEAIETGSLFAGRVWQAVTGRAIDGPLAGVALQRLPSHYSFWFAWSDFHPDTELFEAKS